MNIYKHEKIKVMLRVGAIEFHYLNAELCSLSMPGDIPLFEICIKEDSHTIDKQEVDHDLRYLRLYNNSLMMNLIIDLQEFEDLKIFNCVLYLGDNEYQFPVKYCPEVDHHMIMLIPQSRQN